MLSHEHPVLSRRNPARGGLFIEKRKSRNSLFFSGAACVPGQEDGGWFVSNRTCLAPHPAAPLKNKGLLKIRTTINRPPLRGFGKRVLRRFFHN